jgi:ribokinase
MKKRILIVGPINMDLVLKIPRFPIRGENLYGESLKVIPGGKGANQAVAVSRLGHEALMAGRVGKDHFGELLMDGLRGEGVEVRYVDRDLEAESGTPIMLVEPDGTNTGLISRGANGRFSVESAAKLAEPIRAVDLVLLQLELPHEPIAEVIRLARSQGKPVVLDAGPPCTEPFAEFFDVSVLSPNEFEAEALTGLSVSDERSALRAARLLLAKGPEAVVIKLGARGALLVSAGQERLFPAFRVHTVDTIAAGDAFTAALAASLVEGKELEEAVLFANAAGALATTKPGAQPSMPNRQEIEALLASAPSDR